MAVATKLGTETFNTTSGTHTVVATPAVNDLIILIVANTGYTGTTLPTDNNADGLGTYTLAASAAKATSADTLQIYVRNALIGSATSTTFTHAPGTTTGGGLIVVKVTGMTKTGSSAVRSSGTQANQAAATAAPVLSNTPLAANPVIAAIFNATSPATLTPRTGYTELADVGYSTPTTGLEGMSRNSGETSATITWGNASASAFCSAAIELDSAPSLTQASFRFYEDGSESASTATAAQDTNVTRDLSGGDSVIHLRVRIQNNKTSAGDVTDDFQLQYSLNGGTYEDVTT